MKPGIEYQGLHWDKPITAWDRRRDRVVASVKAAMRAQKRGADHKEFTIAARLDMGKREKLNY